MRFSWVEWELERLVARGKEVNIGKWSDISVTKIPDLGGGNMLEEILSIKVAEVSVTLVGLLIRGIQEDE